MPKQYLTATKAKTGPAFVNVVELSFWELAKLMMGRELETITVEGRTVIRCGLAYEALNLSAPACGS